MSACNTGDLGLIPGLGRSPGEGSGNPLQDSCPENPMDREAWWATVHGVTKSRTRLSDFTYLLGFSVSSDYKESACNAGDTASIPGWGKISCRREWLPTPVFLPGASHGRRSLVGYSPWGPEESDTTERLHLLTHIYLHV